jgi:heme ABC exporter ATP-binding subunit CcmA
MNAVAVAGVWKFFGDFPALRDVTLTIAGGSCTALLGRNGAGKTTLLRILAGLSRPAKGQVTLDGRDVRDSKIRSQVGVLGHGIGIYDELTALENLKLFGSLYGLERPRQSALDWLERVGLQHVKDAPVREFSRGMRQRLAVARAFLHDPRILLLDEPFTALDDRAIAVLQSVLRRALEDGRTVIMSTHQLREALELATDVALLVRGKLAYFGDRTPEMLADPGWLYREYGDA